MNKSKQEQAAKPHHVLRTNHPFLEGCGAAVVIAALSMTGCFVVGPTIPHDMETGSSLTSYEAGQTDTTSGGGLDTGSPSDTAGSTTHMTGDDSVTSVSSTGWDGASSDGEASTGSGSSGTDEETCVFADAALEEAVRAELGLEGGLVPVSMASEVTQLWASAEGIATLEGIECLVNLEELFISDNSIDSLHPLAGLPIKWLSADGNPMDNLDDAGVSLLTTVEVLSLEGCGFFQIDAVNMPSLRDLYIDDNNVNDISPLGSLPNLEWLYAQGNAVQSLPSLSPSVRKLVLNGNSINSLLQVAGLPQLEGLQLMGNDITGGLEAVLASGLGEGEHLFLQGNPVDCLAEEMNMEALEANGVIVHANCPGY